MIRRRKEPRNALNPFSEVIFSPFQSVLSNSAITFFLNHARLLRYTIINPLTYSVIAPMLNYFLLALLEITRARGTKIDEKTKTKIKPLWGKIMAFVASSEDESKYREILANLSYWLSLVVEIDEDIFGWIKTSGKYIDQRTELFFVEYLLEHVSKTPQFVAEIFYEIVSSQRYFPRHRKEEIVGIVKKLFEFGQVEKAKRICNLYLESGYPFLREIYDECKDS